MVANGRPTQRIWRHFYKFKSMSTAFLRPVGLEALVAVTMPLSHYFIRLAGSPGKASFITLSCAIGRVKLDGHWGIQSAGRLAVEVYWSDQFSSKLGG